MQMALLDPLFCYGYVTLTSRRCIENLGFYETQMTSKQCDPLSTYVCAQQGMKVGTIVV